MSSRKMLMRFAPEGASKRKWTEGVCTAIEDTGEGPPLMRDAGGGLSRLAVKVLPVPGNLEALARLALGRDCGAQIEVGRVELCGRSGSAALRQAVAGRFKMRAGLARRELEFEYHFLGLRADCPKRSVGDRAGRWFSFEGCTADVDGRAIEIAEFSITVNNNLFAAPADESRQGTSAVTAGRASLTGYICARRAPELLDGKSHSLRFVLPAAEAGAVMTVSAVAFNWQRKIENIAAGPLDVLYFEDAVSGLDAGLDISLEKAAQERPGRAATTSRL